MKTNRTRTKKITALFLACIMIFSLVGCGSDDSSDKAASGDTSRQDSTEAQATTSPKDDSDGETSKKVTADEGEYDTEWAIYWYLCGSDLESENAFGTIDLGEMMEVELPDNVKVLVQTGGATMWQNDYISEDTLQRYEYSSEGMYLVDEQPSANMGDPDTLVDFLQYATENYPANHTMVLFWNHGGGTLSGVAFDELYEMDSLSIGELYAAFGEVYEEDEENQPIDIIGFDTCLMATLETAYNLSGFGKYLVASEETEPGNGWYYSGWLGELADNPDIEAVELGKAICDTYVEGCEIEETDDDITLSVTNLSKIGALVTAYDSYGTEALSYALEDTAFYADFAQIAWNVENYGGNTREEGYTNMADLGHLARSTTDILPQTSQDVIDCLDDCIEYNVKGKYRQEATGLACYYAYDGEYDSYEAYAAVATSQSFKTYFEYAVSGEISDDSMEYLGENEYFSDYDWDDIPDLVTLESADWEDVPVTVDDDGYATIDLGSEAMDILSSVTFELYYVSEEDGLALCLGTDNDLSGDYETGIFQDNFRGVWGSIDGALCYMEISFEGEDYNIYTVPILLNGEEYNLSVVYDYEIEEYYILGARKGLYECGAADKNIYYLQPGDEIQTIHYVLDLDDEYGEYTAVPIDTIIVTEETTFDETELGDGVFIMYFKMSDCQGNSMYSEAVTFTCEDGEIYVETE